MSDFLYLSQPVAVTPATGTQDNPCCSSASAVGAAAATTPQDLRPADQGAVAFATAAGAVRSASSGRSCRCWWVALAAVVIVAVVARSQ